MPLSTGNFLELAVNDIRSDALSIIETGLNSIDTSNIINSSIKLSGDILSISGKEFNLSEYKKIYVIGFGKASCKAAQALENVLGSKINEGLVIGIEEIKCDRIETFCGTHPKPSTETINVVRRIFNMSSSMEKEDLVIVIVSGGGSSLFCWPEQEYIDEVRLYDGFVKASGDNIMELNTIRKHISAVKGGGLAKILYPATVIGLIFSDVPGDHPSFIASGPTYKDTSTVSDAEELIKKYNLGSFELIETPKEDMYFENVHNFVLVSNQTALNSMRGKATSLGYNVEIISTEMYDEASLLVKKVFEKTEANTVILVGGEPKIIGDKSNGTGGRCLYMGLCALKHIENKPNSIFISLATDGIDNSPSAGALVDIEIFKKMSGLNLNVDGYINNCDGYPFFEKTNGMLVTGPTNSNVSDIIMLINK